MNEQIKKLVERHRELSENYLIAVRVAGSTKSATIKRELETQLARYGGEIMGIELSLETLTGIKYIDWFSKYIAE